MDETLERNLENPRTPVEREIAALGPWFHNLHLPCGAQTAPLHPLGDFPRFKWERIAPHIPERLDGWSALDIGCNAGFYSFALAERGARALGVDVNERYLNQARWAAEKLGAGDRVEFAPMQLYDLARSDRAFDLVWFMGVFYHLRYPLLALDIVRRKTRRMMVFQTMTMPGDEIASPPEDLPLDGREALRGEGWPALAFIERRLAGDPTNWWAPNAAAVEALLRASGFRVVARPAHEIYICEPAEYVHPEMSDMSEMIEEEYRAATGAAGGAADGARGAA